MKAKDMTNKKLAGSIREWQGSGLWASLPPATQAILLEAADRLEAPPAMAKGFPPLEVHSTNPESRVGMASELYDMASALFRGAEWVSGGAMVQETTAGLKLTADLVVKMPNDDMGTIRNEITRAVRNAS
jgi:hypothetical protein